DVDLPPGFLHEVAQFHEAVIGGDRPQHHGDHDDDEQHPDHAADSQTSHSSSYHLSTFRCTRRTYHACASWRPCAVPPSALRVRGPPRRATTRTPAPPPRSPHARRYRGRRSSRRRRRSHPHCGSPPPPG